MWHLITNTYVAIFTSQTSVNDVCGLWKASAVSKLKQWQTAGYKNYLENHNSQQNVGLAACPNKLLQQTLI